MECQPEVQRDVMEEERRFLEEAIRVSAKQQARVEAMGFEWEMQVQAEQWDADEVAE